MRGRRWIDVQDIPSGPITFLYTLPTYKKLQRDATDAEIAFLHLAHQLVASSGDNHNQSGAIDALAQKVKQ